MSNQPEAVFTVRYEARGVAQVRARDQYAAECIAAAHVIGWQPSDAVIDNETRAVDATGWSTTKGGSGVSDAPEYGYEFGIMRPAPAPDMSGRPTYTQIVSATFRSYEQALAARWRVPSLRGAPALICRRPAPGPWEEAEDD